MARIFCNISSFLIFLIPWFLIGQSNENRLILKGTIFTDDSLKVVQNALVNVNGVHKEYSSIEGEFAIYSQQFREGDDIEIMITVIGFETKYFEHRISSDPIKETPIKVYLRKQEERSFNVDNEKEEVKGINRIIEPEEDIHKFVISGEVRSESSLRPIRNILVKIPTNQFKGTYKLPENFEIVVPTNENGGFSIPLRKAFIAHNAEIHIDFLDSLQRYRHHWNKIPINLNENEVHLIIDLVPHKTKYEKEFDLNINSSPYSVEIIYNPGELIFLEASGRIIVDNLSLGIEGTEFINLTNKKKRKFLAKDPRFKFGTLLWKEGNRDWEPILRHRGPTVYFPNEEIARFEFMINIDDSINFENSFTVRIIRID